MIYSPGIKNVRNMSIFSKIRRKMTLSARIPVRQENTMEYGAFVQTHVFSDQAQKSLKIIVRFLKILLAFPEITV